MTTFSEPTQVLTIKKDGQSIVINRVTKLGTSRVFFYPTFEGQRITNTNYGRQYDAKTLGINYLNHIKSKNAQSPPAAVKRRLQLIIIKSNYHV